MSLDLRYIPLFYLWDLFSDKDTGDFLRNGYLKFWRDIARTTGKPVYQITGSPPNYSYINYGFLDTDGGWRVDLNDQGALDSVVYAFPYNEDGTIDLYYVQCFSSGDVPQFTREGIPNIAETTPSEDETIVNFVPNPQFLLHTNLLANGILQTGEIRAPITQIAYGGWSFERPNSSSARDFVTFVRFGSDVSSPDKSPRYACRLVCESSSGGDTFKDLCLRFNDVNKFSYSANQFTYAFWAQVNSGSAITVSVVLKKNYGTGGSTPDETVLGTFTIGTSYASYFLPFSFGNNSTKTIGTLDDDYLQLAIRFPVNAIFDISVVDFDLAEGNIMSPSMPFTTNSQMMYRALSGFTNIPDYNSNDLYLPLRLTPTGLEFDHSEIGNIYARTCIDVPVGYLVADGSQFITQNFSSDGIPYSRLQQKYFNPVKGLPLYGTGQNFVTTYYINQELGINSSLRINNNSIGTVANYTDGSNPTGFTFSNITAGTDTPNVTKQYGLYYGNSNFYIWGQIIGTIGAFPGITPNTSGFTVTHLRPPQYVGTTLTKSLYSVTTVAASAITGGSYFTVYNTTGFYIVWYKVNGVGTQPSVPGTLFYIEIDLQNTWSSIEVAKITASAISGSKITNINTVAASVIPQSSFWNLNTQSQQYYVWYNKDSGGTDPLISGKIGIQINITSSLTAAQVGQNTLLILNAYSFAVPDLRGMILKGVDASGNIDTDNILRWSFSNQMVSSNQGNLTGTFQFDEITQHNHSSNGSTNANSGGSSGSGIITESPGTLQIFADGGAESRPLNMDVNYLIKY